MSGVKTRTVVVTETELNDLRRRAARATDLAQQVRLLQELQEKSERFRRQQEDRINNLNRTISNMGTQMANDRAAASKEVQAVRDSMQRSIQATNATLQEFMNAHQADMQNMQESFATELSQVKIDTANMISANNRRIEAVMNANNDRIYADMNTMRSQLTENINEVRNQVNTLEAAVAKHDRDEAILLEMAREYFAQAGALADEMRASFRVELLCPGRLAELQQVQERASEQINDAQAMPVNAPVARQAARRAMEEALQLYQDVVMAEQEWNMRYQQAQQAVLAAETQLEASREMDLSDEQGAIIVDVEHWSNGALSELEGRLGSLREVLAEPEEIGLDTLTDIREAGLQISEDIDTTAGFAGVAFFASQDRADIAQDIADSMRNEFGLEIAEYSYEGEDKRGGYRARLISRSTGLEMVVSQTPCVTEEGRIANQLETDITSFGSLSTEMAAKAEAQVRAALCGLTQLGFEDTPTKTADGYENRASDRTERANIREFRTAKAPAVAKPALSPEKEVCRTAKAK